jgi:hypothetical protein
VSQKKKSLGRNPFAGHADKKTSGALKQLIQGKGLKGGSDTKEVDVTVKLTPANLKQLDAVRQRLAESGKGVYTRDQLIRIAIALLSSEDV